MDSNDSVILETNAVSKRFSGIVALDEVSISVSEQEIRAIIGPNGAGKTTLFNIISGLMAPTEGRVQLGDVDVTGWKPWEAVQHGVVRSFQVTNVFPNKTVFENIRVATQSYGMQLDMVHHIDEFQDLTARVESLLSAVGLANERDTPISELSHGMRRQVELGMTVAKDPEVLMLDEPTAGMSPEETHRITSLVRDIRNGDLIEQSTPPTILIVEHDMNVVADLADRITVLSQGRVLQTDTFERIADDEEVQKVYLGK